MFGRILLTRTLLVAVAALVLWAIVARASTGAGPERTYVVRPHDTLWSIAARFYAGDPREGIWKLERRNGLNGTLLVPGQVVHVPG
jgi:nucleoid-associated protein YgaU